MRYLILLLLFVCFVNIIYCRPAQPEEEESTNEEEEYEVEPSQVEEQEAQVNEDDAPNPEEQQNFSDINSNAIQQRNLVKDQTYHSVDLSDAKSSKVNEEHDLNGDDSSNVFEGFQFYPKWRQSDNIQRNNAMKPEIQRLGNQNVNSVNYNHNNLLTADNNSNKRASDSKSAASEEGHLLFGTKDTSSKIDSSEYGNAPEDPINHYSQRLFKIIRPRNRPLMEKRIRANELYANRERRDTDVSNDNQAKSDNLTIVENDKGSLDKVEDGETAIKKYIKKLSGEELQELLSSLSEEKQNLLKKIIDDSNLIENDSLRKREITKKAEAVEGSSFNENSELFSKIQGESVSVTEPSVTSNTGATETNKQSEDKSENREMTNTKTSDDKYESQSNAPQQNADIVMSSSTSNIESNDKSEISATPKNENKREAIFEDETDNSNNYVQVEESGSDPQEDQFSDDETLHTDEDVKYYKRDVERQSELDSKMKSLQESFPNSDAYDESNGPLVRVKRKNAHVIVKKRSAEFPSDANVAYFPYRAENDEENEEGTEFGDDGFYERSRLCSTNIEENKPAQNNKRDARLNEKNPSKADVNKDRMSLGTDTDNVLSGVEGVDENLMFSDGSRNRRTSKNNSNSNNVEETNSIQNIDDKQALSGSNMNNPNYQEHDAFGPLMRNYDGDLERYKRIRRLKQSHPEETASDT